MKQIQTEECAMISGGNIAIPFLAAATVSTATNLLAWTIKTSYQGRSDDFSSLKNYLIEGASGVLIGVAACAVFIAAA